MYQHMIELESAMEAKIEDFRAGRGLEPDEEPLPRVAGSSNDPLHPVVSTAKVAPGSKLIVVNVRKPSGETQSALVGERITVALLKQKVASKVGLNYKDFRLIKASGDELDNNRKLLTSYKVADGDILDLATKGDGGVKTVKKDEKVKYAREKFMSNAKTSMEIAKKNDLAKTVRKKVAEFMKESEKKESGVLISFIEKGTVADILPINDALNNIKEELKFFAIAKAAFAKEWGDVEKASDDVKQMRDTMKLSVMSVFSKEYVNDNGVQQFKTFETHYKKVLDAKVAPTDKSTATDDVEDWSFLKA